MIKNFKCLYKSVFAVVLSLSILFGGASEIYAAPLTLQKLLTGLKSVSSGMSLAQKNEYITLRVSQIGVNFPLNAETEKQLRTAGASNQLIETVRANGAKITPTVNKSNAERLYESHLSAAHDDLENGRRASAAANFTKAINLKPDDAKSYFYRGLAFYLDGDYERAAADYRKATELDPQFKSAFNNLGLAYQKTKQFPLALNAFDKTIELDRNNAYFYTNRGQLFSETGDNKAALADYDKAIALNPLAITYGNRAFIYYRLRDFQLAVADFNRALKLDPKYTEGYLGRGNVYFDLRKYDLAVADLSEAIRQSPKDARYYNNRAAVYVEMNKYELAAADLRKALEIEPNAPSIRRNLERVLRKLEN